MSRIAAALSLLFTPACFLDLGAPQTTIASKAGGPSAPKTVALTHD
jgi:hypothetical protein